MKFNEIVQRVQELRSGHESVTEGMTDGLTGEGHSYSPHSASRQGINKHGKAHIQRVITIKLCGSGKGLEQTSFP